MFQRNACSNNCFSAATTGSSVLQSKVNAKFMIFIVFESHDKTCSKIEKTWFLLVNQVTKKQLSEWKKSSSHSVEVLSKKGFLKNFAKFIRKHRQWTFFSLEVQVSGVFMWILQNFKNTFLQNKSERLLLKPCLFEFNWTISWILIWWCW